MQWATWQHTGGQKLLSIFQTESIRITTCGSKLPLFVSTPTITMEGIRPRERLHFGIVIGNVCHHLLSLYSCPIRELDSDLTRSFTKTVTVGLHPSHNHTPAENNSPVSVLKNSIFPTILKCSHQILQSFQYIREFWVKKYHTDLRS